MWKVKKIVSKGDYNYAVVPEHPYKTKNNYVLEHRIVMENYLGRLLDPCEVVHHLNGVFKDNRIENLELCLEGEHQRMHAFSQGKEMVKLKCPECQKIFIRSKNITSLICKDRKLNFCSKVCSGLFSRKQQLHRETITMERAISENIVSVYKVYKRQLRANHLTMGCVETIRPSSETVKK